MGKQRGVRLKLEHDASWLAEIREAVAVRGWSHTQLADAAGTSKSSVTRLFLHGDVTDDTAAKVSRVLGVRSPLSLLSDPRMQDWLAVGAQLRSSRPKRFEEILKALESAVARDHEWARVVNKLTSGGDDDGD